MQTILKIGITGGIGSGKTTITKVFESFGIPVFYSDEESKFLLDTDETLKSAVKKHFGNDIYNEAGTLKRQKLASAVFANKDKLEILNNISHPAVRKHFLNWVQKQTSPYILKEAAIMYESGANRDIDIMIMVFCPKELRIQRLLDRGNITKEQIEARMNKQMSEEDKMKLADFTIYNDDQQPLLPQIIRLHELFLNKTSLQA